jgi:hypothetical protein
MQFISIQSKRGIICALYVCFHFLVSTQARAQIVPSNVSQEWGIGETTFVLNDYFKARVEDRVALLDHEYINRNIKPLMLMYEVLYYKTLNMPDTARIPHELVFTAFQHHHLIRKMHNESRVERKADMALWGLSKSRVEKLKLHYKLHQNSCVDETHHLLLTTEEIFKILLEAHKNCENWLLSLLAIEMGYEQAMVHIQQKHNKGEQYKRKDVYELSFQSDIILDYFALRHILTHLMHKQPRPEKHLFVFSHEEMNNFGEIKSKCNMHEDEMRIYNAWLSSKKKKNINSFSKVWVGLGHRTDLKFPMPALPKKVEQLKNEPKPKPEIQFEPKNDPTKQQEAEVTFIVPQPENKTEDLPHLHRVKQGETLIGIARTYNTSVETLRLLNPHKKHTRYLHEGDVLITYQKNMKSQTDINRKSHKIFTQSDPNSFKRKSHYQRQQRRIEQPNSSEKRGEGN